LPKGRLRREIETLNIKFSNDPARKSTKKDGFFFEKLENNIPLPTVCYKNMGKSIIYIIALILIIVPCT